MQTGTIIVEINEVRTGNFVSEPFMFSGAGLVAQLIGSGNATLQGSNFNDIPNSWIDIGTFSQVTRLEKSIILLYGRITFTGPARIRIVASEYASVP